MWAYWFPCRYFECKPQNHPWFPLFKHLQSSVNYRKWIYVRLSVNNFFSFYISFLHLGEKLEVVGLLCVSAMGHLVPHRTWENQHLSAIIACMSCHYSVCLLNRLFGHRSKEISKVCVTGLCERASNEENVSTWWHHHVSEIPHRSKDQKTI